MNLRVITVITSKPIGNYGGIIMRIILVFIFAMIMILPVVGTTITLEPDQIESGDLVTISIYDLPDGSVFSLDMQANLQVTPGSGFSFETANFIMPFTLEDGELAATMQNTQQNVLDAKKNDTEVKKIGNSVDGYYSTSESGTISAGTYEFIKLGGIATPDATEVIACLSLSGTKRGPDNSQISFYAIGTSAGSMEIVARVNGAEALNQVIIMGNPPATTSSTTSPTPTYTYSGGGGGGGYTSGNTYTTTTVSLTQTTASPEMTKTEVPAQETAKSVTAEMTTNPATESVAGTPPPTSAAAHCLVAVLAILLGVICVSMRKR
jgi:hypothetical protein